ncbi:MAG: dihydrolipoyl dehydrogenase [Oscillospiraceae bacterium]
MPHIAIIGGGPGGYVAAIRAAQLGAQVTLVEKAALGGTCLNCGCIPTKALLHTATLLREAQSAVASGILCAVPKADWPAVQREKQAVVRRLVAGVDGLLKANRVQLLAGAARFTAPRQLAVALPDGTETTLSPDKIIIASGSVPAAPPIPGAAECPACLDSTALLALEKVPASLVVVGAGAIGLELATVYRAFGTTVTVLEALPEMLPGMDSELARMLRKQLEKQGIALHMGAGVQAIRQAGAAATVAFEDKAGPHTLKADVVLLATGRRPATESLSLEAAGIAHDGGRIVVDAHLQTNQPGVYAIGDCLGRTMLAHVASAQGEAAAEHAMGVAPPAAEQAAPACVYTWPEFASVGLSEQAAKAAGTGYSVGKFPLSANGRALIAGIQPAGGAVKLLFAAEDKKLLGAHILGPAATELIAECALALHMGATSAHLAATVHPHPSVSEAIREAALAAENRAIHTKNRR